MSLAVSAVLSQSGTPRQVRVYVEGLAIGEPFRVTGTAAGHSWTVRGGFGDEAASQQLVLTDVLTPLGRAITYQVSSGDDVATAPSTVTVDYDGDVLLQSIDGDDVIDIRTWRDNGDPIGTRMDRDLIPVAGRVNPILRYAPAGGESGQWELVLTTANTQKLRSYFREQAQLVMRLNRHTHYNGTACDIPPVRVVALDDVRRVMHGVPGLRVWELAWTEVDDPLSRTVMVGDTWSDVDAAYEGDTWADLDAAYPGTTWGDWNRFDWAGAAL